MLPTRADNTFLNFNSVHVDASATCSCFAGYIGLSEFALSLVTCAQLSSNARTAHTHIVASYPLVCKVIVLNNMLPLE